MLHFPLSFFFFALPSFHPLMAALVLPSLHSQSGFSRMREWGSLKKSVKHLRKMEGGPEEVLDIRPLCDHRVHTHTHTHTDGNKTHCQKTYMCTHAHTQTPNVLHTLLLTPTPSEPSPTPSPPLTHSLSPKLPLHFPSFLHCTWFKSCISGLLDWSTKALLMHPGEAPLERPRSHPG